MTLKQVQAFKSLRPAGEYHRPYVQYAGGGSGGCRGKVWLKIDKTVDNDIDLIYETVRAYGMLDQVLFYFSQAQNTEDDSDLVNNSEGVHRNPQRIQSRSAVAPPQQFARLVQPLRRHPQRPVVRRSRRPMPCRPETKRSRPCGTKGYIVMTNLMDNYDANFISGDTSVVDAFLENGCNVIQTDVCVTLDRYLRNIGRR